MTVPYTQSVSTARIGGFFRLLFRWRGSIYQVIYGELIIFIILYYALNFCYRWLMKGTKWQTGFEAFAEYCEGFADFIPLTFVLGFYVVHACARRWTQWENLPWPDKLAFNISGHLVGSDMKSLMLRRTLIRYANLATVLCYRDISIAVRKRLPTLKHVVEAGTRLYFYVATLAVYLFMLASLFGRQYVKKERSNHVDLFVPVFPFLQVVFYLGWLKVGEVLTNPFGGDADDFEMNYIIDRNLRLSYTIVDEHYNTVPPIEKDVFWNVEPDMPHTVESSGLRTEGFIGSAVGSEKVDHPPLASSQISENGSTRSRSSSIRATIRAKRQAMSRPFSRLLSRNSNRDSSTELKLLESNAEKDETGEEARRENLHSSPLINRRQNEANLRTSHPSRLPSICEGSENILNLGLDNQEDTGSLITFTTCDSKSGSRVTTPTEIPSTRRAAVLEEDETKRLDFGKPDEEKSPILIRENDTKSPLLIRKEDKKSPLLIRKRSEESPSLIRRKSDQSELLITVSRKKKKPRENIPLIEIHSEENVEPSPLHHRRRVASLPDLSSQNF